MNYIKSLITDKLANIAEEGENKVAPFDAAMAAIERAAAERAKQQDRRESGADRRQGLPDSRPAGSPERRLGSDRRSGDDRRGGADRRGRAQQGFGKRGA